MNNYYSFYIKYIITKKKDIYEKIKNKNKNINKKKKN